MRYARAVPLLALSLITSSANGGPDQFGVTFVPGAQGRTQIERMAAADGIALLAYTRNADHTVLLVRRTKPGQAEVHTAIADVWYVVEGSGTLVTGGKLQTGKTSQSGEWRAASVSGGIARHIGEGDIIDIPAGVPHWVSKIDGSELVYLTVKVATSKH